ncbi:MAG: hypothetical protein SRB1_01039 [Desulfobacteraceae bacterium Eth-SRB1]|nr:MAG: hypothetical protein SRB1_01039 [Desulfobacteraceae bacterium Eth-SRB1]
MLYVSDLVKFVELVIEKQQTNYEFVNVAYGKAITIKEYKIIECSGKKIAVKHDLSQPHIPTSLSLDIFLAKKFFGWQSDTSLQEGIRKTMAWYRANIL